MNKNLKLSAYIAAGIIAIGGVYASIQGDWIGAVAILASVLFSAVVYNQ